MKGKGLILAAILVSAVAVFVFLGKKQDRPRTAVTDLGAPEIFVTDPAGKIYTLSDLKGSVIFINFWATWCEPCRDEAASIHNLYNRFKDEKAFRLITLLHRDDYQKAMTFLKEKNYEFPVWTDNGGKTAVSYGITGVPETYIVSKKGVLKERIIGPADWSSTEAIAVISKLLQE